MKALLTLALALSPWAAQAADLQDWSSLSDNVGPYSDSDASKVVLTQADPAVKGEHAVDMKLDLIKWGGLWANVPGYSVDLSKATGIRFMAKAVTPGILFIALKDAKKVQGQTGVRVAAGDWQEFKIPMSALKRSEWQDPEAPKGAVLDLAHISSLNMNPHNSGKSEFIIGPISALSGKFEAKTGLMQDARKDGKALAQDFEDLEVGGYGTYADDKGSKVDMLVADDSDAKGNHVGVLNYDLKPSGWCGAWVRVGDGWQGMDWSGGKTLSIRVKSSQALQMSLAFNDNNQVAYTADLPMTQGKGWETLSLPLSAFKVNEYYQPPQAKKGAALDLSHIESFNIGLRTEGKGSVRVDDLALGN